MSQADNWVQSGNFGSHFARSKKEVEFNNLRDGAFFHKLQFIENSNLWSNNKTYSFVINLGYKDINEWISKAPNYVSALNNAGGKASFSYVTTGQITVDMDSSMQVLSVLNKINAMFAAGKLPFHVMDTITNYASPNQLSIFDHAYKGNVYDVETILKAGKRADEKDSAGQDLLHIAYLKNNKKLAETALKWGASIDSKDNNGKSILTLSVEAGDYDWYKFASNKNASKLVKDANFDNLLHIAVKSYKGLLDMNKKSTGTYSLEGAGLKDKGLDYKLIIKDLAKKHDLVKQSNKQGETPISIASETRGDKSVLTDLVHEIKHDFGASDVLTQAIWAGAAWADII